LCYSLRVNKAKYFGLTLLGIVLLWPGCTAVRVRKEPQMPAGTPVNEPPPSPFIASIQDYKNRAAGTGLRPWIRAYFDYDNQGIEALEQYRDVYAFVALQSGDSTSLLDQWLRSFSLNQDFPRLVAARIRRRFTWNLSRSAAEEYGKNLDEAVRAAYNTPFSGARKEDDSWVFAEEPETAGEYRYLILFTVPRDQLEEQINEILSGVRVEGASRDQSAAFNRVRGNFFEGF
jgi:hypothetical protein